MSHVRHERANMRSYVAHPSEGPLFEVSGQTPIKQCPRIACLLTRSGLVEWTDTVELTETASKKQDEGKSDSDRSKENQ